MYCTTQTMPHALCVRLNMALIEREGRDNSAFSMHTSKCILHHHKCVNFSQVSRIFYAPLTWVYAIIVIIKGAIPYLPWLRRRWTDCTLSVGWEGGVTDMADTGCCWEWWWAWWWCGWLRPWPVVSWLPTTCWWCWWDWDERGIPAPCPCPCCGGCDRDEFIVTLPTNNKQSRINKTPIKTTRRKWTGDNIVPYTSLLSCIHCYLFITATHAI